jgi:hypothetical protein
MNIDEVTALVSRLHLERQRAIRAGSGWLVVGDVAGKNGLRILAVIARRLPIG